MHRLLIPFDSEKHHIYVEFEIIDIKGFVRYGLGILDTGAPRTEFSDLFLNHIGLFNIDLSYKIVLSGQETKKYHKINLSSVTICGCQFQDTEFIVSRFEKSWGIDALIGLDLFRKSLITIDYRHSHIIAEPY